MLTEQKQNTIKILIQHNYEKYIHIWKYLQNDNSLRTGIIKQYPSNPVYYHDVTLFFFQ